MAGTQSPYLAKAIQQRMTELGMSPTDLQRASGVSDTQILRLRNGDVRRYQVRTTANITRALGWTHDSIELLLNNEPARLASPVTPVGGVPVTESVVSRKLADVDALASKVVQLEQRLEDRSGMAELAREVAHLSQLVVAVRNDVDELVAQAQQDSPEGDASQT